VKPVKKGRTLGPAAQIGKDKQARRRVELIQILEAHPRMECTGSGYMHLNPEKDNMPTPA
jgi:hypothetical protein